MLTVYDNIFPWLFCVYMFLLPLLPSKLKLGGIPVNGDSLFLLLLAAYLLKLLIDVDTRRRFVRGVKSVFTDSLTLFMLLLAFIMLCSTIYSQDKIMAIKESVRFFSYFILFFIVKYELTQKVFIDNLLRVFLFTCFIMFTLGILDKFFHLNFIVHSEFYNPSRLEGTLENSNNLGAFSIIAVFPLIVLTLKEKSWINRVIYLILTVLALLNMVFAGSRNSYLAFAIGCMVLILIFGIKYLLGFGVLGGIAYLIPMVRSRVLQIFDMVQNMSRIVVWKTALKMIGDFPLLGVGNGNFYTRYEEYVKKYPELRNYYDAVQVYHPHNIFLKTQCELGVIGSIAFLGILGSIAYKLKQFISMVREDFYLAFYKGFAASFIAFIFMNCLDNFFSAPKVIAFFWILLAASQSLIFNRKGRSYNEINIMQF